MGTLWNAKSIKLSSPIVPFYVDGDEHPGCVKRISHYLSIHRLFWQCRTNSHKRQFICSVTELTSAVVLTTGSMNTTRS